MSAEEPQFDRSETEEGDLSPSSLVPDPYDMPLTDATVGGLVASLLRVWEGPLPSPDAIAAYEETLPGLAERITAMAEKEQDFRHRSVDREFGIKERDQAIAGKLALQGQHYALVVIVIAALFGAFMAHKGEGGYGIAVVLFAIGCVAAVVALGKFEPPWKKPSSEESDRQEERRG